MGQTFEDFEINVSDNASTDGTEQICRAYDQQDSRVRYSRNEKNLGIMRNFNGLFQRQNSGYFKWAAADDVYAPDYLLRTVEVLDHDPSTVLVSARQRLIDQDGTLLTFDEGSTTLVTSYGEVVRHVNTRSDFSSPEPHTRFRAVVMHQRSRIHEAHVYGLIRSAALGQTALYDRYVGSEKVYTAHLSLLGRFHEVPKELFTWRLHPERVGKLKPADQTRVFDPEWSGRFVFMGAKHIAGYLRAIRAAPLSGPEKALCTMVVLEKIPRGAAEQAKGRLRNATQGKAQIHSFAEALNGPRQRAAAWTCLSFRHLEPMTSSSSGGFRC